MEFDGEEFYELHDRIAQETQRLTAAGDRELPSSATDESGTIRVSRDGRSAITVAIGDGWRSARQPDDLSAGVFEAIAALAAAQTAEWSEGFAEASDAGYPSVPTPPVSGSVAAKVQASLEADPDGGAALTRTLENVLAMLDDFAANIDETFAHASDVGRATFAAKSSDGNVEVEVGAAGDVLGITFSEHWLARATAAQISRELNATIAQATQVAADAQPQSPFEGTPLAGYQQWLDDPDVLVEQLRGKGR